MNLEEPLLNCEVLYSKVQRVYLKSSHQEERVREIRINVELLTGNSPICQQNLAVQLTDDEDPFFLYNLLITEEEFKTIKSQQRLVVDFDSFPSQFIKLLDQCRLDSDGASRFLLILDDDKYDHQRNQQRTLKVVETNNFKHLCHLCLNIGIGTDAEVKNLMASKIKLLKECIVKQEKQICHSETQLREALRKLEEKSKDLEEFHREWNKEKSEFHVQSMRELSQEREKMAVAQLEWQRRLEKEKQDFEERHENIVRDYESAISELKSENQKLIEKHSRAEANNREQAQKLEVNIKELNNLQREVVTLRKQTMKLDEEYHEKDRTVNSLRTKLAVVEQEVKDKGLLLAKQQELLAVANEQKAHLEDSLAEKEASLQRKHCAVKKMSDEIIKANEILGKQQSELSSVKSKLKLRTSIALEQERLLDRKQKEIANLMEEVAKYSQHVKVLEESERQLKETLASVEAKIDERDKQLKNNDNVITWLNRRLNEVHTKVQPSSRPTDESVPVGSRSKSPTGEHRVVKHPVWPLIDTTKLQGTASIGATMKDRLNEAAQPNSLKIMSSTVDPKYFKPDARCKKNTTTENEQESRTEIIKQKKSFTQTTAELPLGSAYFLKHPPK